MVSGNLGEGAGVVFCMCPFLALVILWQLLYPRQQGSESRPGEKGAWSGYGSTCRRNVSQAVARLCSPTVHVSIGPAVSMLLHAGHLPQSRLYAVPCLE
jgi:hypothetical protein